MSIAQSVRKRRRSQRYYESPLNVFKRSLEELTSLVDDIVCKKEGKLTRGTLQKLRAQHATRTSNRESSSQNSIIVISDSETVDGHNDNETSNDENDTSLSVIEGTSKLSLQEKRKSKTSVEQNTSRSSIIPLDNDSSVLCLSDRRESLLNEENIAPTEDDVVELWSCLKKSNVKKNRKCRRYNCGGTNALFTIDKKPNPRYLRCLRTSTKYVEKEKEDLSHDKITPELFKSIKRNTSKCSDSSNKKRPHKDNLDSYPTKSNIHHSKKKVKSNTKNINRNNNQTNSTHKLREIIIDGCNVAMAYTNGKEFSEKGIQIVVDYFKLKGHVVKVFLPQHVRRKKYTFLEQLYKQGTVIFTPSRNIDGRQITSYDDRYILEYATLCGGIVISTDQYRDLYKEKPEWRDTILNRLLIPTFVGDYIMFPEDPLGRFGPNLETFLRHCDITTD